MRAPLSFDNDFRRLLVCIVSVCSLRAIQRLHNRDYHGKIDRTNSRVITSWFVFI
jgi:hypothetical protein